LAANDTLTKSFAETAKDQIEQMGGFHDCTNPCDSDLYQATAPTWNSASTFPTGYVQYAHYNVGISAVQCIDTATPGHACTVEELTITMRRVPCSFWRWSSLSSLRSCSLPYST
jgi:hypothetical protein